MHPRVGGGDETSEQRVRLVRFAVKLRMKLAGDEEGMFGQFDDLHQFPVRREPAQDEAGFLESFAIRIVEFVAMAMALLHHE